MAQEPRSLSIKESFRRKNVTKYQKLRYLFKGMFKATPPDRKWQICFFVVKDGSHTGTAWRLTL